MGNGKHSKEAWEAVRNQNPAKLKECIADGWEVNEKTHNGTTILHFAVQNTSQGVLKVLLEHKCNPDIVDKNGQTALHICAVQGRTMLAKELIHAQCDINKVDANGRTALHLSCLAADENEAFVSLLLSNNANAKCEDTEKITCFQFAINSKKMKVVKMLVAKVPEWEELLQNSNSSPEQQKIVEKMKTDRMIQTYRKLRQDMVLALQGGKPAEVKELLEGMRNVYAEKSPIGMKTKSGRVIFVPVIIDLCDKLFEDDMMNVTIECLEVIFAEVDWRVWDEYRGECQFPCSLLRLAIGRRWLAISTLLQRWKDNYDEGNGLTSLSWAVKKYFDASADANRKQSLAIVQFFIKARWNPNKLYPPTKEHNGQYLIHVAAYRNDVELLDLLLNEGKEMIDKNIKNSQSMTALEVAKQRGSYAAIRSLEPKSSWFNFDKSGLEVFKSRHFDEAQLISSGKCEVTKERYKKSTVYVLKPVNRAEVDIMSKLRHTKIITLYGIVALKDTMKVVMEYASRGSLRHFLDTSGSISDPNLTLTLHEYAYHVIMALQYLHACHIVHGDVKSQNVYITNECAKLGDFGESWVMQDIKIPQPRTLMGTPSHMAPEIWREDVQDMKVDVYAFGNLLWEITNPKELPYKGISPQQIKEEVLAGHRLPKGNVKATKFYIFDEIMTNCWETDPKNRPKSTTLEKKMLENLHFLSPQCHSLNSLATPAEEIKLVKEYLQLEKESQKNLQVPIKSPLQHRHPTNHQRNYPQPRATHPQQPHPPLSKEMSQRKKEEDEVREMIENAMKKMNTKMIAVFKRGLKKQIDEVFGED